MDINLNTNLCHLDDFGCIEIKGADTIQFLQGQITTNVKKVAQEQLDLSAMCSPKGRCIALFFITKVNDSIFFILAKETIETALLNLKKYAVFFKIEIFNVSINYNLYSYLSLANDEDNFLKKITTSKQLISLKQLNQPMQIILVPQTAKDEFNKLSKDKNIAPQSSWLDWMANHRIPWLTAPGQDEFLPHNLNLPQLEAVDFTKGCFTGQEVIARMQYKGKLKAQMQLFHCKKPQQTQVKAKIWADGQIAGEIISHVTTSQQKMSILALIKDRYLESENFRLNDENGSILKLIKMNC